MEIWQAILLAIVEGITEYLPVSSTGHLIITNALLGIDATTFTKLFTINIQFGAILSVLVLYWRRFLQSWHFYGKLLIAFIPAAVVGLLAGNLIDAALEHVWVIATALVVGGIVLILCDKWFAPQNKEISNNELAQNNIAQQDANLYPQISYKQALFIGLFQCIALIPGISRSAATIVGGLAQRLSREQAAEFSFFLAVPTLSAASGYKLLKDYDLITSNDLYLLAIGNVASFIVGVIAIQFLIKVLKQSGFKWFGWYRIILGLLLLGLLIAKIPLQII